MSFSLGRPVLTQAELQAHATQLSNQDVIYNPLYDASSYPTAGQTQLNFFATPVGQGTTSAPGANGTKTLADTNLNSAGQLTKGNEFFMTGQEFLFFPGQNPEQQTAGTAANGFANDTYDLSKSGYYTLQVQNRNFIQDGPIGVFPPSVRLALTAAVGGTDTAGTQSISNITYAAMAGQHYSIVPVYLTANLGFTAVLNWPAAVTLSATARIFNRMTGYLVRNAQ